MHVPRLIAQGDAHHEPSFSFEYFPPKTAQGVQNLYSRIERMAQLSPRFVDVTWGAGGRVAELTCEMIHQAQAVYGIETCMHLTCTDTTIEKINEALHKAYKAGCTNILALRGDPPRDQATWEASISSMHYARDLVLHIRKMYGNHFGIGVAGYPEGCDDNKDEEALLLHLREKVDAGATFIVTQMFYDVDNFLRWVRRVRDIGITVPIIPGIMPIATYASFLRRAKHMNASIPQDWMDQIDPIKNDDSAVRQVGTELVATMCRRLLDSGLVHHLHFYTMNLAQSSTLVLEELGWLPAVSSPAKPALPWKQSLGLGRRSEDVRPIFWRNRNRSYVLRTQEWDEFPNGRWGDSRSPAFGGLDTYGIGLSGTNEANRAKWGEPTSIRDVSEVFVKYIQGELSSLPWSEAPLTGESDGIRDQLISLNRRGFLTVNSQPAIDGVKSDHPVYGWGPPNGYVYQKAYLELLIHPSLYQTVVSRIREHPDMIYYAVTKTGALETNAAGDGPNAVTWGVFPGKEIVQPTIVEAISFLAWKDEAFLLGTDWAHCFESGSVSRDVLETIMNSWYLVNIVNNDFHDTNGIFPLFDGLDVTAMVPESVYSSPTTPNYTLSQDAMASPSLHASSIAEIVSADPKKLLADGITA